MTSTDGAPEMGKHGGGSFFDLLQALKIHFIHQEHPLGLGDAITRASDWVAKEPFFLMLPDNLFFGEKQPLAQLIDLFQRCGKDILSLIRIDYREAQGFGNSGKVKARPIADKLYRIDGIENKGPGSFSLKEGEWSLRGFPRSILLPHFFDILEEIRQGQKHTDLELDDVPALQLLSKREVLLALELDGKGFDVGNHHGYLMANAWCLCKFGPPKRGGSS